MPDFAVLSRLPDPPACGRRAATADPACQWATPGIKDWDMASKLQILCSDPGYACPAACLQPVPPRDPTTARRVRRAVHSLGQEEWQRVIDALWVMRRTPDQEGQQRYGPAYRSYSFFTIRHKLNSYPPPPLRDTTGGGPEFLTWHAAELLEFEVQLCFSAPRHGRPSPHATLTLSELVLTATRCA